MAQECELTHRFPREIYKKAGELGFIGLDYPEDVGGGDLGVMENVLVIEEFCKADSGMRMAIHLAYLPAKILKIFGTPEQHRKFLSPLVKGDWVSMCPKLPSRLLMTQLPCSGATVISWTRKWKDVTGIIASSKCMKGPWRSS